MAVDHSFLDRPQARVAGVRLAATSLPQAVGDFIRLAGSGGAGAVSVRFVNAYSLALAADDPVYRSVLRSPGVNLPDGAPVGWVMRWRCGWSRNRAGRVRGPSFFAAVLDQGREAGLRHYLLGSTEQTLAALHEQIAERFPGAVVAGSWSPPFVPLGAEFFDEAVRRVEEARPDVVWLGLGTPKQDLASPQLTNRTGLPVVGVGAAFDFVAGTLPEAPLVLRDHGLEWAYRFAKEPKRLWRRYLLGNVRFIAAVVQDDVASRRSPLTRPAVAAPSSSPTNVAPLEAGARSEKQREAGAAR